MGSCCGFCPRCELRQPNECGAVCQGQQSPHMVGCELSFLPGLWVVFPLEVEFGDCHWMGKTGVWLCLELGSWWGEPFLQKGNGQDKIQMEPYRGRGLEWSQKADTSWDDKGAGG